MSHIGDGVHNEHPAEAAVVGTLVLGPVTMHNELTAEAAVVGTVFPTNSPQKPQ